MKPLDSPPAPIPPHGHGLAQPMPRRRDERKEDFLETRHWHDARSAKGLSGSMAR
jgi:hypothetical protein